MDKSSFIKQIFNLGSFGPHGTKCASNLMVPPEGQTEPAFIIFNNFLNLPNQNVFHLWDF